MAISSTTFYIFILMGATVAPDAPLLQLVDEDRISSFREGRESTLNSSDEETDGGSKGAMSTNCPPMCVCGAGGVSCLNAGMSTMRSIIEANLTSAVGAAAFDVSGKELTLNFAGNYLVEFNCIDVLLTSLRFTRLILDANRITHVYCHEEMNSVQVLSLRGNRIQNFEVSVLDFYPNLKVLDLSDNKIHSFLGLMRPTLVTHLNLSANRMADLEPRFLHNFGALESLDLSDNGIYSLTSDDLFGDNRRLTHLDFSHNKISKILPNVFRRLVLNGSLNLGHNALHHVPREALRKAAFVRRVIFGGNHMSRIETGDFNGTNVVELDLNHLTRLKTIGAEAFSSMPLLAQLEINRNPHLVYVSPNFAKNLPNLKSLGLSRNGLLALDEISRQLFPALEVLDVSLNPFRCSCYIDWIRRIGKSLNLANSGEITCSNEDAAPGNGNNRPLQRLVPGANASAGGQVADSSFKCWTEIYALFPATRSATVGEHVSFDCAAFGRPDTVVKWVFGNGSEVPAKPHCLGLGPCQSGAGALASGLNTLSIEFLTTQDAGTYRCTALTPASLFGVDQGGFQAQGSATATTAESGSQQQQQQLETREVHLHVHDVHVTLVPVTIASTFVTVSWNGSSIAGPTTYVLEYRQAGLLLRHYLEVAPGTNLKQTHTFTVKDLEPGRPYEFTLSLQGGGGAEAGAGAGAGPASARGCCLVRLAAARVTTHPADYARLLGVRSDYLSILVICVVASAASCTCILVCLARSCRYAFRRAYFRVTGRSWDCASRRQRLLNSTSTTSDVAFISISYNMPGDACFLIGHEEVDEDEIPRM